MWNVQALNDIVFPGKQTHHHAASKHGVEGNVDSVPDVSSTLCMSSCITDGTRAKNKAKT